MQKSYSITRENVMSINVFVCLAPIPSCRNCIIFPSKSHSCSNWNHWSLIFTRPVSMPFAPWLFQSFLLVGQYPPPHFNFVLSHITCFSQQDSVEYNVPRLSPVLKIHYGLPLLPLDLCDCYKMSFPIHSAWSLEWVLLIEHAWV